MTQPFTDGRDSWEDRCHKAEGERDQAMREWSSSIELWIMAAECLKSQRDALCRACQSLINSVESVQHDASLAEPLDLAKAAVTENSN